MLCKRRIRSITINSSLLSATRETFRTTLITFSATKISYKFTNLSPLLTHCAIVYLLAGKLISEKLLLRWLMSFRMNLYLFLLFALRLPCGFPSLLVLLLLLQVLAKKSQLMYHLHAQLRGMDRRQFIWLRKYGFALLLFLFLILFYFFFLSLLLPCRL